MIAQPPGIEDAIDDAIDTRQVMTERSREFFLDRLAQRRRVSVLIIGGGINGAGLFRDL